MFLLTEYNMNSAGRYILNSIIGLHVDYFTQAKNRIIRALEDSKMKYVISENDENVLLYFIENTYIKGELKNIPLVVLNELGEYEQFI